MMETIIVLAVFFILTIIFYAFYSDKAINIDMEKDRIRQLEAVKVMQQASSLNEIQCSEKGIIKNNCVDLLKIDTASVIMQSDENREFYFDKFGFSKITIKQVYPEVKEIKVIYDNSLQEYSYKDASNIPVSLFEPIKNEYYFGVIALEIFQK